MKIWIVSGTTGEYSSRSEWVVCAYTAEADAAAHVAKASQYAEAWHAFTQTPEFERMDWHSGRKLMRSSNPMDPSFSCDYTGTTYEIQEVELRDHFEDVETVQ